MAVFYLPKIPVQEMYYFQQLSINTFGIARKSPDDVISFVVHSIEVLINEEVDEVYLFCDNCGGQNKNHTFIHVMMSLIELKVTKSVKVPIHSSAWALIPAL